MSHQEVIHRAIRDAKQWKEVGLSGDLGHTTPVAGHTTRLHPIPSQVSSATALVTCHVDGAWNGSTKDGGVGWIFKDSNNRTLSSGSNHHRHIGSAILCEGLSLVSAMESAIEANIKNVCFFSDSQSLIKLINSLTFSNELYGILNDSWSLSLQFEVSLFSFIPRASNEDADRLAKQALHSLLSAPCTS